MSINFEEDAAPAPAQAVETQGISGDGALRRVSTLADAALECEDLVKQLEERVKEEKERLRSLTQLQLPEAMRAAGLERFITTQGAAVEVKREVYASISESNRAAAHAWLREHGHGDLIKNVLSVSFGAGEDADAAGVRSLIEASGFAHGGMEQKEGVHPSTLRVFVREQVEGGKPLPLDLFGAHLADVAKIKRKERK